LISLQQKLATPFQAHMLASRSLKGISKKEKFAFPVEILLAVPLVLIFSASLATLDRVLRFQLLVDIHKTFYGNL
jgi:hypothetical protein